jgi:rubrerythrin
MHDQFGQEVEEENQEIDICLCAECRGHFSIATGEEPTKCPICDFIFDEK